MFVYNSDNCYFKKKYWLVGTNIHSKKKSFFVDFNKFLISDITQTIENICFLCIQRSWGIMDNTTKLKKTFVKCLI